MITSRQRHFPRQTCSRFHVVPTTIMLCLAAATPAWADSNTRDSGIIKNQASPHASLRCVDLGSVHWTGGFWADQFEKTETVTLPRLWELAGPWAWHNMRVAAGLQEGEVKGCFWEDAWIYKWIESACYVYTQTRDPELLDQMDRIIQVIAAAQRPDGYLATQVTLRKLKRFSFHHHHELYTMGHLLTAASVHHRTTGRDNFLKVARRAADFVHKTYGDPAADPMLANCPVNPSIIMGAVELYRTTGERRYLELANIIIDNRGKRRGEIGRTPWGRPLGGTDLNQDRVPLRRSKEVVGHAVFWSYLFAGAADAYMETGDKSLLQALDLLWSDLTTRKMYVTGAVSPVHKGLSNRSYQSGQRTITNDEVHEAAGLPYDLPNATAYNETCGQIGNMMWNWRMLCIRPDARFADVMEQTLYNSILSGIEVDGEGWSYTNPLRWYGSEHELLSNDAHTRFDPGERHICCPTNLLRTIASMHGYLYTTNHEGLWGHHYGANRADVAISDATRVRLNVETDYPWDGTIRLTLEQVTGDAEFAIKLRVPGWANDAALSVNGDAVSHRLAPGAYATHRRRWKSGDRLLLSLPMPVRLVAANPRIEQARGQVAVARGPIVYCLESTDLPEGVQVHQIRLPRQAGWTVRHDADLLGGVAVLQTEAWAMMELSAAGPLYGELPAAEPQRVKIQLIPYYAWNNRGEPQMAVWLPLR